MEKAFQRQVIYGGSLDTILLELGMVPEDRLCQYLALASGLPPAARAETESIDPDAVALLPLEHAQSYRAVPICLEGEALRLAVAAPIDLAALEDLADHVDKPLRPLLVPEYRWHLMLEQAYGVPTPQRFAALASQIEKDSSSQPVGRSRTVIVDNEPERDIVANAQTVLAATSEPARPRTRTTESPAPRPANAVAPPAAPPEPGSQNADLELTHESPTPTETSQGISLRRRATLIGVSPVRALTDEPLQGDLLPATSGSATRRPSSSSDAELEAAERRGPLYDYEGRPTAPRRAQLSPEERAALRNADTRPIARRRPSPESLASISAASLAAFDEAEPAIVEDAPAAAGEAAGRSQRDTEPEPLAAAQRRPTSPALRGRSRPDTIDTQVEAIEEVPSPAAGAALAPPSPATVAPSAEKIPPRSDARASTQPVALSAETSPVSLREARELLTTAEHRDDVFVALLRSMRHVAQWAGLLTVNGGAAIGRLALAHPDLDAQKIGSVLIPLDAPSPVRTAMVSKRPYVGPLAKGDPAVDSMFLRMGDVRPPSLAVIPIVLRDRVVAMIVGHRGTAEITFSDVAEQLPLATLASEAVSRLIVRQKSSAQTGPIATLLDASSAPARLSSPSVAPARPSSPSVAPARPSSPSVAPARPSSPRPARATPGGASHVLPALPSYSDAAHGHGARQSPRQATTPKSEDDPADADSDPDGPGSARVADDPDDDRAPTRPFPVVESSALRPVSAPPPLATPTAGSVPLAATPAPLSADELLDIIEQRRPAELEAAIDEAIARAPEILPSLARRFPGELDIDRHAVTGRPLRAAQYGGLLELVTRLGAVTAELLVEKMGAPSRDVRFYAAVCATELRPRNALPALIERLFDPDLGVRVCALEALQGYPVRDLDLGLPRLRHALHSDEPLRVAAAAHAACELADREAIPDLIAALGRGERFSDAARAALVSLTKADYGTSERKWQRWWDDHHRQHRVEWLIDGLTHKESELRRSAIVDLRRLTGESLGYEAEAPRRERDLAHRRWLTWWNEAGRQRFTAPENERRRPTGRLPPHRD